MGYLGGKMKAVKDMDMTELEKQAGGRMHGGFETGKSPRDAAMLLIEKYGIDCDLEKWQTLTLTDGTFAFTIFVDEKRGPFKWKARILNAEKHEAAARAIFEILETLASEGILGFTYDVLSAKLDSKSILYNFLFVRKSTDEQLYQTLDQNFDKLQCNGKLKINDGLLIVFRYDDVSLGPCQAKTLCLSENERIPDSFKIILKSKYIAGWPLYVTIVELSKDSEKFYRLRASSTGRIHHTPFGHEKLGMIFAAKTLDELIQELRLQIKTRGFEATNFDEFVQAVYSEKQK